MGSEEREADGGPVHLVLYSHPSAKKKKKKKTEQENRFYKVDCMG